MKRPTEQDLNVAADWLDFYDEGEGALAEKAACTKVAEWLREQAFEGMLREEARKVGVPVEHIRKRLKQVHA